MRPKQFQSASRKRKRRTKHVPPEDGNASHTREFQGAVLLRLWFLVPAFLHTCGICWRYLQRKSSALFTYPNVYVAFLLVLFCLFAVESLRLLVISNLKYRYDEIDLFLAAEKLDHKKFNPFTVLYAMRNEESALDFYLFGGGSPDRYVHCLFDDEGNYLREVESDSYSFGDFPLLDYFLSPRPPDYVFMWFGASDKVYITLPYIGDVRAAQSWLLPLLLIVLVAAFPFLVKERSTLKRLLVFGMLVFVTIYIYGYIYYGMYFEDPHLFKTSEPDRVYPWDFVYFSAVTFTTLGYGDIVPNGPPARGIVVLEILCAVYLISFLGAIVAGGLSSMVVLHQGKSRPGGNGMLQNCEHE